MKRKPRKSRHPQTTLTSKRLIFLGLLSLFFASCQATRVISTVAESTQYGDTTVIIQTKTTESYFGKKN